MNDALLQVYLQEYIKLKDEQIMRIRFRDGMVPLSLAAVGALTTFALTKDDYIPALLLTPVISVILGWLYAVNDDKVSQLGKYLRRDIADHLTRLLGNPPDNVILGWEVQHRDDPLRDERKHTQHVVDVLAFVLPGVLAVSLYTLLTWPRDGYWSLWALPFGLLSSGYIWSKLRKFAHDKAKGK